MAFCFESRDLLNITLRIQFAIARMSKVDINSSPPIPHHGSKNSYNHELALMDAFHVVSAGKSNRFRHPHSVVIKDLLFENKYPYIVTEEKSSEVIMKINI